MTKRPALLLLILLAQLSACATAAGSGRYPDEGEPTPLPTAPAATKPTYTVGRGDISTRVTLTGRVSPAVEESLSFPLDGQVGEVLVEQFDTVAEGDPLALLDTTQLDQELLTAQSELDIAQARLAARQAEVVRALRRAELRRDMAQLDLDYAAAQAGENPNAAEQYEIDRLRLALTLAQLDVDEFDQTVDPALQVEVDQAALRLQQVQAALGAARIVAPFDGTVLRISKDAGRSVAAGEPVLILADISQLQASAGARDAELEQLSEDLPATIGDASGRGETLSGTVARLPYPYGSGGAEEAEEGDKTVHLAFDDQAAAQAAFELGDRVTIVAVTETHEGVLWLPPAAVREFGGRRFVVVDDGGVQQRVDVELGIQGDGRLEILGGLSEGQIVVGQ